MSLKIWLPLNGNLKNLGLSNLSTPSYNNLIINNNGKIGQCYSGEAVYHLNNEILQNTWSLCAWIKADSWYSNNNIVLCKNSNSGSVYLFYFSIIGGTLIGIGANSASVQTKNYTFNTNTWYHVAATYNSGTYVLYVNGKEEIRGDSSNSFVSNMNNIGINCRSSSADGTSRWIGDTNIRYINDVRIYDHCLSALEIKEIALGLILHYKMDNNGRGGRNLIRIGTGAFHNTDLLTTLTWTGWDSYNSLALTDMDWNNRYGQQITYSCYVENIEQTAGTGSGIMLHVRYADGTYLQFGGGKNGTSGQYLALGESGWLKLVVTIPDASARSSPTTINYIEVSVRHNSSSGASTIKYKCPQVELGNKLTAWYWAPEDSNENTTIVEDSSGYNYNGTIIGNPMISSDTIRYSSCTNFPSNTDGILSTYPLALWNNAFTYSFWIKPSGENGTRSVYAASYNGISCSIEKTAGNKLRFYWNGSPDLTTSSLTITDGIWQHIAIVKSEDKTKVYCYYNGELKDIFTNTFSDQTFSGKLRIARDTRGNATSYTGLMSDFRIYCTALLNADIKLLYNVGMKIDKKSNSYTGEFQELDNTNTSIKKTAIVSSNSLFELKDNIPNFKIGKSLIPGTLTYTPINNDTQFTEQPVSWITANLLIEH